MHIIIDRLNIDNFWIKLLIAKVYSRWYFILYGR